MRHPVLVLRVGLSLSLSLGLRGLCWRFVFSHRRVELVVYDGVLLVSAGGEGESRADLHLNREIPMVFECLDRDTNLERHISRDVEEDGVASPRGSHQDGDLLSLTRLLRWRLGFCLRGVRRGGVRGHSARGGIYCQKYLLCSNLRNLQHHCETRKERQGQALTWTLLWYRVFRRELAWSNNLFGIASVTCL